MTGDDEPVLVTMLIALGEIEDTAGLEAWYRRTRDGGADGERHFQNMVEMASGFQKASLSWYAVGYEEGRNEANDATEEVAGEWILPPDESCSQIYLFMIGEIKDQAGFEAWRQKTKDGSAAGERHYRNTVQKAKANVSVVGRSYTAGYEDGRNDAARTAP